VARCCVDPNALEWGHLLFLAVWERGYAESYPRTSENSPSRHLGEEGQQNGCILYGNAASRRHQPDGADYLPWGSIDQATTPASDHVAPTMLNTTMTPRNPSNATAIPIPTSSVNAWVVS
jgi:hypothetical protein